MVFQFFSACNTWKQVRLACISSGVQELWSPTCDIFPDSMNMTSEQEKRDSWHQVSQKVAWNQGSSKQAREWASEQGSCTAPPCTNPTLLVGYGIRLIFWFLSGSLACFYATHHCTDTPSLWKLCICTINPCHQQLQSLCGTRRLGPRKCPRLMRPTATQRRTQSSSEQAAPPNSQYLCSCTHMFLLLK